jgi:hypothetical protein
VTRYIQGPAAWGGGGVSFLNREGRFMTLRYTEHAPSYFEYMERKTSPAAVVPVLPDMVELTDTIRASIDRQRIAWQTGVDVEPGDVEHVTL